MEDTRVRDFQKTLIIDLDFGWVTRFLTLSQGKIKDYFLDPGLYSWFFYLVGYHEIKWDLYR